jgi:hypothetical protein
VSCVSATDCVAVGNTLVNSMQVPAIGTWDGTSWSIQSLPMPAGDDVAGLSGIACESASACVAAGDADLIGGPGIPTVVTLAEQWNGASWSVMSTPNPSSSYDSELKGIACTATTCTATGTWDDENPLAEQWNGASWTLEPTPEPATPPGTTFEYVTLGGVACSAYDACIALGTYTYGGESGSGAGTLIERWHGVDWTIDSNPNPVGINGGDLVSASCESTGTCMAVGAASNSMDTLVTLAEQYTP